MAKVNDEIIPAGVEIQLDETGYGSGQHQLVVLAAKYKHTLEKFIKERRYARTHNGDRPGQVYAAGLQCLRYIKGDSQWQAVCVSSTYWDV